MNSVRQNAPGLTAATALAAALSTLVACATAGTEGVGDDDSSGDGPDAGAGFVDAGGSFADAAGMIDASGTTDAAPASIDAAPTGTPDAAPASACPSGATCTGATVLGSVSGDTANQKLTASGHQSAWFRVRVTENFDDITGLTLRVGAKLTSPTGGADYDVFLYVSTGQDVLECSTTSGSTTSTGTVNNVHAEWGEGLFANGADDDRDVSIEVRPVSGTCTAGQPWQLEVEGNWP